MLNPRGNVEAHVYFIVSLALRLELTFITIVTIKTIVLDLLQGDSGWTEVAVFSLLCPAHHQTRFALSVSPEMKESFPDLVLINYNSCLFPVPL